MSYLKGPFRDSRRWGEQASELEVPQIRRRGSESWEEIFTYDLRPKKVILRNWEPTAKPNIG